MRKVKYLHPHLEEINRHVETMHFNGGNRQRLRERTQMLMECYARHGRLAWGDLPKPLRLWVMEMRRRWDGNELGDAYRRYWQLVGTEVLDSYRKTSSRSRMFHAMAPRELQRRLKAPVAIPAETPQQEALQALLDLKPDDMVMAEGDDDAKAIWWHYLWQWREVVKQGGEVDETLRRFAEMQDLLLATKQLDARQVEVLKLVRDELAPKRPIEDLEQELREASALPPPAID